MDVLKGIRVVDLTMWAFVPSAGAVMGHWGADVIKVESTHNPDPMRLLGGTLAPGDGAPLFKHYSRAKRAIALDLATDEGREILYDLVRTADVFLTSFLPRTRKKLRFDVDDIRAVNPNIIYARGTGQGPRGPEAERGGYDGATWWYRGSLAQSVMNVSGADWPTNMVGHGDGMSGMTLAGGICAALLKRALTGKPSIVDASLLGTAIWFNGPSIISAGLGADMFNFVAKDVRFDRHPTANTYRTKDGRFLNLTMLGDFQDEWEDLCQHLGHPELITDPRFATGADRTANMREGVETLDAIFAERTLGEWKQALVTTKGVWAPCQRADELFDDPQTIANGFLRPVHYVTGDIRLPVPPILFDEEAGDPPPAPDYGQHTDEVLGELGKSGAEIARLRAAGIVA